MLEIPEKDNTLLGSRDILLQVLQKNNYEFSTLRKAKYSTMGILIGVYSPEVLVCKYCNHAIGDTG